MLDHTNSQSRASSKSKSLKETGVLRDAAGEVDSSQVLGGRDGVTEHRSIGGHKLDDVGGQAALPHDLIDGVAGGHGCIAGFP